jgi:hypothetical protein
MNLICATTAKIKLMQEGFTDWFVEEAAGNISDTASSTTSSGEPLPERKSQHIRNLSASQEKMANGRTVSHSSLGRVDDA